MLLTDMPRHGECSAPTFDDTRSEELPRFFDDLELLLGHYNVIDKNKRKQVALCYLSFQTETLWKMVEAWTDQTKTYQEFWDEIYKLYPGSSGDRIYTIVLLQLQSAHFQLNSDSQ